MELLSTTHPDVKLVQPRVFGDERGFFMETFRDDWFREHCANVDFVQDNHSLSSKGILRGLHYQTACTQGKLVRVTHGSVFDVAVDMRRSSPHFGQWVGAKLSSQNNLQMWVPEGFAHGFYVTSNEAEFCYRCTDYYHPESEVCIRFDDSTLGIEWPIGNPNEVILSEKDKEGLSFINAPAFT